jgi:hypothetical protein
MKTRSEAVRTLLAAGWTLADVKSVLGDISESGLPNDNRREAPVPWWTWVNEEWYPVIDPMNVEYWGSVS